VKGVRPDDGVFWSDEQHCHRLLPDTLEDYVRIMSSAQPYVNDGTHPPAGAPAP
jgi:hypothetical protein